MSQVEASGQTDSLLNLAQLRKEHTYTDLKKAFKHPEKVIVLDLSGQELDSLPETIGSLINLQVLLLGPGPKKSVPKRILRKSKHIGGGIYHLDRGTGKYVGYNKLTTLPESMKQLTKLQYLNLSYNQFDEIPEMLQSFKNLKMLSLSECRKLFDNATQISELKTKLPEGCIFHYPTENEERFSPYSN